VKNEELKGIRKKKRESESKMNKKKELNKKK
jgi:hypothetical protein